MKLLLDTHAFLWHLEGSPEMSATGAALLVDPANELFLSMASAWEIAIKVGLRKLVLADPYLPHISQALIRYRISLLPITFSDCADYEQLPFPLERHRDPFDRMIITHAGKSAMPVVGSDVAFDAYGVVRLW